MRTYAQHSDSSQTTATCTSRRTDSAACCSTIRASKRINSLTINDLPPPNRCAIVSLGLSLAPRRRGVLAAPAFHRIFSSKVRGCCSSFRGTVPAAPALPRVFSAELGRAAQRVRLLVPECQTEHELCLSLPLVVQAQFGIASRSIAEQERKSAKRIEDRRYWE